jgi:hypothetical protein
MQMLRWNTFRACPAAGVFTTYDKLYEIWRLYIIRLLLMRENQMQLGYRLFSSSPSDFNVCADDEGKKSKKSGSMTHFVPFS